MEKLIREDIQLMKSLINHELGSVISEQEIYKGGPRGSSGYGDPYSYKVVDGEWWAKGPKLPQWKNLKGNVKAYASLQKRFPDALGRPHKPSPPVVTPKPSPKLKALADTPFKSTEEGNKFRLWVRDKSKNRYSKVKKALIDFGLKEKDGSTPRLSSRGPYNNDHMKVAYSIVGKEYKPEVPTTPVITPKPTKADIAYLISQKDSRYIDEEEMKLILGILKKWKKQGKLCTLMSHYSVQAPDGIGVFLENIATKGWFGGEHDTYRKESIDLITSTTCTGEKGDIEVSDDISDDFKNKINFDNLSTTDTTNKVCRPNDQHCAQFVNDYSEDIKGVGHAWHAYRNHTNLGPTIFNRFTNLNPSDRKTLSDLWLKIHKNKGGNPKGPSNNEARKFIGTLVPQGGVNMKLQPNDVVGLYYKPSSHHEEALYHGGRNWFKNPAGQLKPKFGEKAIVGNEIKKGNAWGMNTHVGIVGAIKDGIPLVFHNVTGNVKSDPVNNLNVAWIKRPPSGGVKRPT